MSWQCRQHSCCAARPALRVARHAAVVGAAAQLTAHLRCVPLHAHAEGYFAFNKCCCDRLPDQVGAAFAPLYNLAVAAWADVNLARSCLSAPASLSFVFHPSGLATSTRATATVLQLGPRSMRTEVWRACAAVDPCFPLVLGRRLHPPSVLCAHFWGHFLRYTYVFAVMTTHPSTPRCYLLSILLWRAFARRRVWVSTMCLSSYKFCLLWAGNS